jgi:Mlc titration factor MtfA (ptsG expression regulator)
MIGLIIIVVIIIIGIALYTNKVKKIRDYKLPANTQQLLTDNVPFYNTLDDNGKQQFETRIKDFLANTTIRGVDVEVDDLDRILIASGAIMLIFAFPDWKYNNLSEVLLYDKAFNAGYSTEGKERDIIGMVGDGPMHREMILSKPSLRSSFQNPTDGHNTVIHEFAHLIDKADGSVDGVPEYLLAKPHLMPWLKLVHDTIQEMRANGVSDINYYGATNPQEFFAVVSEYFFERPNELKENHPELYALLDEMFHPAIK